jgi:hypothetical protein
MFSTGIKIYCRKASRAKMSVKQDPIVFELFMQWIYTRSNYYEYNEVTERAKDYVRKHPFSHLVQVSLDLLHCFVAS